LKKKTKKKKKIFVTKNETRNIQYFKDEEKKEKAE